MGARPQLKRSQCGTSSCCFLSERTAPAWKKRVQEGAVPPILPSKTRPSTRTTTASMHRFIKKSFATVTPEAKSLARAPDLLILTKANLRSTVHRQGYLDYIGVKRLDAKGQVLGEQRFLGLFTSTAYASHPTYIPLLRRKVDNVIARAGLDSDGHMGKALVAILEQHPRDELFQASEDELFEQAMGILVNGYRKRTRLFVRSDRYGRFLSFLVYVPRENYSAEVRERTQQILMQAFNGTSSEFTLHLSNSALARVLITVRTQPGSVPSFD